MAKLIDITGKCISGEWGLDDNDGTGIPVLRTTNFTNDGIVNFSNVVTRQINKKNLSDKYLKQGDIIIEKSGGSDNQPVGRVIYFDGQKNTYLFNNFTGLLRVADQTTWLPKYVFYALFANYQNGGTKSFENKTTGLHNLKTDSYVQSVDIKELSYEGQKHIVTFLDKITHLIFLRKQQLLKLDELVKSRFIEMFGDVITNTKGWKQYVFTDVASSRLGKMLDAKHQTGNNSFPYLANFNVQWFKFDLSSINQMDFDDDDRVEFELKEGDLLVCEGGEIGRCAVWHNEMQPCYFQKALHRVRCNTDLINPNYMAWWFKYNCEHNGFAAIEGAKATIAHLPGAKLKLLSVTTPPIESQDEFAAFIEQIDKSKLAIQKSLEKLEILKKSLMQQYFG